MSKEYMVGILKLPNKKPKIIKIAKRLKNISNLIGGEIEEMYYKDVLIIFDREQKSTKLDVNKIFNDLELKGNILIVGNNQKEGDMISLRKRQLVEYMSKINNKSMEIEL